MLQTKQRKPLKNNKQGQIQMTRENILICLQNQQGGFQTHQLNDVLHFQYYGFTSINNLQNFYNVNTIYLNSNTIQKIQNMHHLINLVTVNLSHNRIKKIQNLQSLTKLSILDISYNKISKIQNLEQLFQLSKLNVSGNLIKNFEDLEGLKSLTIGALDLSNNQIQADQQIYKIFPSNVAELYLRDTMFSRGIVNYRKKTILNLKQLLFLDQRPVTKDQRLLINAWNEGGIIQENKARKFLQGIKQEKNKKQYQEMQERTSKVQKLRQKLFEKLTQKQRQELSNYEEQYKQLLTSDEQEILYLKIKQLKQYIDLIKEQTKYMTVSTEQVKFNSLITRQTSQAVYVYNITEDQLEKVKDKFFSNETRSIICKNYHKTEQAYWIQQYQPILQETANIYKGKINNMLPVFNMKIHELDEKYKRKPRRFTAEQLKQKFYYNNENQITQLKNQLPIVQTLDELD